MSESSEDDFDSEESSEDDTFYDASDEEPVCGMDGSVPSNDERVCSGGVTKAEALILIILFVIRSGLSMTGMKDALFLVNTLFGRQVVPSSLYMFEKSLNFCKNFDLVYYCLSCSVELTSTVQKDIQKCRICKKLFDVRKSDGSGFFFDGLISVSAEKCSREFFRSQLLNYKV